jgi:hypothetical protein
MSKKDWALWYFMIAAFAAVACYVLRLPVGYAFAYPWFFYLSTEQFRGKGGCLISIVTVLLPAIGMLAGVAVLTHLLSVNPDLVNIALVFVYIFLFWVIGAFLAPVISKFHPMAASEGCLNMILVPIGLVAGLFIWLAAPAAIIISISFLWLVR